MEEATPEHKTEYVKWRVQVYQREQWQGSLLSEYLSQDFEEWSISQLKEVDKDCLRSLRGHLREFGVYVPVGRAIDVATAIKAAIDEELPWPTNDKTPNGPTDFRTTVVKPFLRDKEVDDDDEVDDLPGASTNEDVDPSAVLPPDAPPPCRRGCPRKHPVIVNLNIALAENHSLTPSIEPTFEDARRRELQGLMDRGVFEIVHKSQAHGRLFGSRFVDDIKQCASQRVILTVAALLKFKLMGRDISMAYPSSTTKLIRHVFIKPPKEIGLPGYQNDVIFRDKLITACRGIPACEYACYRPASTIAGVISDLQSSIETYSRRGDIGQPAVLVQDSDQTVEGDAIMFTERPIT